MVGVYGAIPSARGVIGSSPWGGVGYSRYGRQGWGGSDWMGSTAGLVVLLAIVLVLLTAYWTFRAIWLVVRVLWQHPHERRLWVGLGACVGAWALAGLVAALATPLPSAILWPLLVMAITMTAVLLLTAKLIELQGDTLLQRAFSKETLIEDVLTRPWWKAA